MINIPSLINLIKPPKNSSTEICPLGVLDDLLSKEKEEPDTSKFLGKMRPGHYGQIEEE